MHLFLWGGGIGLRFHSISSFLHPELRACFHFSYFVSGSAFTRKVKGFCSLFFRGINKTQNSHEIRKVYSECFVFVVCFAKTLATYTQNTKRVWPYNWSKLKPTEWPHHCPELLCRIYTFVRVASQWGMEYFLRCVFRVLSGNGLEKFFKTVFLFVIWFKNFTNMFKFKKNFLNSVFEFHKTCTNPLPDSTWKMIQKDIP